MSKQNVNAALSMVDESTPQNEEFLADVLQGLSQRNKTLPCKYFYDEKGSQLFEAICDTPEYYITRTEIGILQHNMAQIADLVGPSCDILEFGAGAGVKIQLLLDGLKAPRSYIPIDISMEILESSAQKLARRFPHVDIVPIVGDYHKDIELPEGFLKQTPHKKLVFFPGSTISNFTPEEALGFLARIRKLLAEGDVLLIGVDCIKPTHLLNAAYNDKAGVTAAFNLNLLDRIADTFDTNLASRHFLHHAYFNSQQSRIEMHLVSKRDQIIRIEDKTVRFARGETIHTENSYKYSLHGFKAMAEEAAFETNTVWQDEDKLFSLHYLTAT
ncbi:L-histidine N(alpha)-methyltransferase [Ketobacter alkanivorans]|uniref:L-histidine N(Alpha)-methyltransferase n=1 Tax=Ketobacter alkanivorans TaxID=1917421 RepID=A0A2K9LP89_9GAMM|nr:L-histidine N(alpha)-methyltransferase [Ketobacter alkanivorans]AUM12634.1 L-histidine N(alpha)-methyltransferase [Ketobacter alkanivorans]